jgi:hypothetical protein
MGNLAAGAISNLYYPAKDRDGVGLTFEGGAIGIGASAGANLIQISHQEVDPKSFQS